MIFFKKKTKVELRVKDGYYGIYVNDDNYAMSRSETTDREKAMQYYEAAVESKGKQIATLIKSKIV